MMYALGFLMFVLGFAFGVIVGLALAPRFWR